MGTYLNMVNNDKPNAAANTHANENYARELMQLFTLGMYKLNPDGSLQLEPTVSPIPTYDQNTCVGHGPRVYRVDLSDRRRQRSTDSQSRSLDRADGRV